MPGNERGGSKAGAGRKPGRDVQGRLPQAPQGQERPYTLAVLERFQQALTIGSQAVETTKNPSVSVAPDDPQVQTVAELAASGMSWSAIERATGREAETCKAWRAAYPNVFVAAVHRFTSRLTATMDPKAIFSEYVPDAVRTANEIMTDPTAKDSDRIAVLKDVVLAYALDKPVTRTEISGIQMPTIMIVDSTLNIGSTVNPSPQLRESSPVYDAGLGTLVNDGEHGDSAMGS